MPSLREEAQAAALASLPQILFVLGKGGVGRSSVATALALMFAARGERVLIMEWTVEEAIAPWFGLTPMDTDRAGVWQLGKKVLATIFEA